MILTQWQLQRGGGYRTVRPRQLPAATSALHAAPAPRLPTSGAPATALRTIRTRKTPQDRGGSGIHASTAPQAARPHARGGGARPPRRPRRGARPLATGRGSGPCWPPRCPHTPAIGRCVLHVIASVLSFLPLSAFLGLRVRSPSLARSWHGDGCEQYGRLHPDTPGGAPLTHPHTQNHAHDQERSARNRLPIVNLLRSLLSLNLRVPCFGVV